MSSLTQKSEYQKYIASTTWKKLRRQALDRAGYCCERCGEGECLQVHHLTYARFKRERLDDLLVLCVECHRSEHRLFEIPKNLTPRQKRSWNNLKVYKVGSVQDVFFKARA